MADAPKVTMADVLGKPTPATSATSDMPTVEAPVQQAPALSAKGSITGNAENPGLPDATPAPPEPKPDASKAPAASKAPSTTDAPGSKDPPPASAESDGSKDPDPTRKPKDGINERFSKLTGERDAAVTRAEQVAIDAAAKLDAATTKLNEALAKLDEKPVVEDKPEPKPDRTAFDTPEAYETALIDWSGKQAAKTAKAEAQREAADAARVAKEAADTAATEARNKELQAVWADRRTKALEVYPDYAEVAESDDLQISVPMAHTILNADDGPDIAYFLGKNPTEAARIAKLNPVQQAYEMGRLSARVAEDKKVKVTKAPEPIEPLGGRANADDREKPLSELSMEDYAARRNASLRPKPAARTN